MSKIAVQIPEVVDITIYKEDESQEENETNHQVNKNKEDKISEGMKED